MINILSKQQLASYYNSFIHYFALSPTELKYHHHTHRFVCFCVLKYFTDFFFFLCLLHNRISIITALELFKSTLHNTLNLQEEHQLMHFDVFSRNQSIITCLTQHQERQVSCIYSYTWILENFKSFAPFLLPQNNYGFTRIALDG